MAPMTEGRANPETLPPRQPARWRVTILTSDRTSLLDHVALEDRKEVQAYCTEARHLRSDVAILIRDPFGHLSTWDEGPAPGGARPPSLSPARAKPQGRLPHGAGLCREIRSVALDRAIAPAIGMASARWSSGAAATGPSRGSLAPDRQTAALAQEIVTPLSTGRT